MHWLKVDITTSREAAEALSAALFDISPSGILVDEKDGFVVLTIYLRDSFPVENIRAVVNGNLDRIKSEGLEVAPGRITFSSVSDEDWVEKYKKQFRPLRIGNFLIRPSWEDVEAAPDEIVIQLDPGLAFGTGSHPTTEGCLLFLQEFVCGGEAVFDLGTGSGILAIAAAKLGAKKVVAIDNDEEAIAVARENAKINGVAQVIDFKAIDFMQVEPVYADILVSNLTAPLLIEFLPEIAKKLEGIKIFIASGITTGQKEGILLALKENGFAVEKILEKGEWVTVVSRFG